MKRHHRVGSLALALALCGSLVSCDEMFGPSDGPESESLSVDVYGTRMFSPAWETGQTDMLATSDQQIDWAIAETEEALLMLGDPDGWDMLVAEGNWAEYRDGRMPELHGTMCELGDAGRRVAGMALNAVPDLAESKRAVGLTMFGVTTACVTQVRQKIEATTECFVFHATGTGGQCFEKLIDSGFLTAALDITTTEVADYLAGGVLPCTEDRFGAIIRRRIFALNIKISRSLLRSKAAW